MHTPRFGATNYDFTEFVPAQNYIGGQWVDPTGSGSLPIENPRYGKAMSHVGMSNYADIDAAVTAAKAALPAWREMPIRERAQIMYKAREIMLRDVEELTWLCSHENGKIYGEAKAEVLK